jgi:hypothetical protein
LLTHQNTVRGRQGLLNSPPFFDYLPKRQEMTFSPLRRQAKSDRKPSSSIVGLLFKVLFLLPMLFECTDGQSIPAMTVACAATQWIYLVLETDKERAVTVTGSSFSSSITPVTFVGLEYSVAYATTST